VSTFAPRRQKCLGCAGIEATRLTVIIVGTVTPDMTVIASTGPCLVQNKIGAKGAWGLTFPAAARDLSFALQRACR